MKSQSERRGGALRFMRLIFAVDVVRVDQKADGLAGRHHLLKQAEALCIKFPGEHAHARRVSARAIHACDQSSLDRIVADAEYDWDARGRRLGRKRSGSGKLAITATCCFTRSSASAGKRVAMEFSPSVFDRDVPACDVLQLGQPTKKSVDTARHHRTWRIETEDTDDGAFAASASPASGNVAKPAMPAINCRLLMHTPVQRGMVHRAPSREEASNGAARCVFVAPKN